MRYQRVRWLHELDDEPAGSMTRDAFDSVFERAWAWSNDDEDDDR